MVVPNELESMNLGSEVKGAGKKCKTYLKRVSARNTCNKHLT